MLTDKSRELNRKLMHFFGLGYILGYWFLPRTIALWAMGIIFLVIAGSEFVRLLISPTFNRWLIGLFGGMYNKREVNTPSGLIYTFMGAFVIMLLFKTKPVILNALWYQVFGDGMAAVFGIQFGKTKIGKKSLEGSIACFIVCFLFSYSTIENKQVAFLAALIATLIELFPFPRPLDNFLLPFLSALSLKYLLKYLG